jgi:hypothetical protein
LIISPHAGGFFGHVSRACIFPEVFVSLCTLLSATTCSFAGVSFLGNSTISLAITLPAVQIGTFALLSSVMFSADVHVWRCEDPSKL